MCGVVMGVVLRRMIYLLLSMNCGRAINMKDLTKYVGAKMILVNRFANLSNRKDGKIEVISLSNVTKPRGNAGLFNSHQNNFYLHQ